MMLRCCWQEHSASAGVQMDMSVTVTYGDHVNCQQMQHNIVCIGMHMHMP
jgi:hypothetical protein